MSDSQGGPWDRVRTKVVATLGPASRESGVLRDLIAAGADVFRLNFSHGTHDEHAETLRRLREAADAAGRVVAVLQDLGGPKIRLGEIPGGAVDCGPDEVFRLVKDRTGDDPRELTCTYRELADDLKAGDVVYFADGAVAMVVTGAGGGSAALKVTLPGRIRSKQGINLPGAALNVGSLTDKDLADLEWTAAHRVDYVGLSFVRRASDVARLRQELDRRGCRAGIVAKIEKPQALDDLDAIIDAADAVMVARGDLGVEIDVAKVPAVQKRIIASCRRARVPAITATQMLASMEGSNRPTRAEASDVFNAVLDGTDAVMLSGESAIGKYPVESVRTMSRIAGEAEAFLLGGGATAGTDAGGGPREGAAGDVGPVTEGVVEAAGLVCRRLGAKLVVVATHTGKTALALSKQRYGPPTLALSDDPAVARSMALYWGVTPVHAPEAADEAKAHELALARARDGIVAPGDAVVIVHGAMPDRPAHNAVRVEIVG